MRFISLLVAMMMLFSGVMVQGQGQISVADATQYDTLMTYYNAINARDYVTAYNLWAGTSQTFTGFVNGFRDTVSVAPYFGIYQESSTPGSGRVPAVLVAYRTNDLWATFIGCFSVTQNSAGRWRISDGDFEQIPGTTPPTALTVESYLSMNCYTAPAVSATGLLSGITEAAQTINHYFSAINHELFNAAYAMWLHPLPFPDPDGQPAVDYRPPFATFGPGYASTEWTTVYTGNYAFGGGAAGKPYLDGYLPVVLVAQESGGRITAYAGCYLMGRFTDGRMGIVNGDLYVMSSITPTGYEILSALGQDCAALGIAG